MNNCYGQHGWREFHRNRKNILVEFEKLIEQTQNRPVKTAHGVGVEAFIRKWLSEFLPKKFGVTSGYIIPDLYGGDATLYHFDIIVYNQLDAPVLWTEGNEDNSDLGKHRAIPAQHVVAIYEVKSRLTKKSVSESLEKLNQIKGFSEQLNKNYSCGAIFIELKEAENQKYQIIEELYKGKDVFGFIGRMVLRYEGDDSCTGVIRILSGDTKDSDDKSHYKPLAKHIDTVNIYLTEDGKLELPGGGAGAMLFLSKNSWLVSKSYGVDYTKDSYSVHLDWSRSNFSVFCIDLLSALERLPYNDSKRPSFGHIFDNVERKKAPLQGESIELGLPFIVVSLCEKGDSKETENVRISGEGDSHKIEFWIEVENQGYLEAKISDDYFRTSCLLPPGSKARKSVVLLAKLKNKKEGFDDLLLKEGLEIPYRLVYQTTQDEVKFFAVEKTVKIIGSEISLA